MTGCLAQRAHWPRIALRGNISECPVGAHQTAIRAFKEKTWIGRIRTRFKGELRRTVLHPIAPEKLTCIRDRAVRHRLSSPSRPVANVHTGMAARQRNCELSAVGILGRHQWREDLRPTRTAVA